MPTIEPDFGICLHADNGMDAIYTGRLALDAWGYLIAYGTPKENPADRVWSTALKQDAERVARMLEDNCFPGRFTTTIIEIRREA